jgi:hypothetical protein
MAGSLKIQNSPPSILKSLKTRFSQKHQECLIRVTPLYYILRKIRNFGTILTDIIEV